MATNSPMKFLVHDLLLLLPKNMVVEKTDDGFRFVFERANRQTNSDERIGEKPIRNRFGLPQQAVLAVLMPSGGSEAYLSHEELIRITKLTHKTIYATVKSLTKRGILCEDAKGIFLTELGADLYKKHLEKLAKLETIDD